MLLLLIVGGVPLPSLLDIVLILLRNHLFLLFHFLLLVFVEGFRFGGERGSGLRFLAQFCSLLLPLTRLPLVFLAILPVPPPKKYVLETGFAKSVLSDGVNARLTSSTLNVRGKLFLFKGVLGI